MARKTDRPKPQLIRCPLCETELNRLPPIEGDEIYFCPECNTAYRPLEGKLTELDAKGNESVLAYIREQDKPSEEPAKAYDVYFESKDKRKFVGIVGLSHEKGWMILTNKAGREVLINSAKVNFVEEVE
jgi:Zn-finger nucleic acid-binding protein